MNKKLLLCVVLICTMLASTVSAGAFVSPITYDEALEDSITNLRILENNQLPDGTAITLSSQCLYVPGGFVEGGQHVSDRTFTLSGITDTDLLGSDLIGYSFDAYKEASTANALQKYYTNKTENIDWINFTVNRDADIYVYTQLESGRQSDNDAKLMENGFTSMGKSETGYMKSSVAIANNTYYGKWKKSVKAGDAVSLPNLRFGSEQGRVTAVAVINYTSAPSKGIKANAYVSGLENPVKLYNAVYDGDGNLVKTSVSDTSANGYLTTSVAKTVSQSMKTFLWEPDGLTPVTKAAVFGELSDDTLNDIDIKINGTDASTFVGQAIALNGSYDIGIKENNLHSIPKVTAETEDPTISLGVKTYPEELKTVVRIAKGALNEEDEVVTLPTSGTQVTTKRSNVETATITFNWVKDYITMSDFVPATSQSDTSSNWNPLILKTLTKRTVKNVTVADGSFKKVQVKFANLNQYSAIIAVQPAAGSAYDAKSIICDSTGAAVTWNQDDTTVVTDYNRKADTWANVPNEFKGYRTSTKPGDAAGTAVKCHYPILDFEPSGYKTGSRIYVNGSARYGYHSLWELGENEKNLAGSAYYVFDSQSGADQVMTFYVADDAVISVLSQDTTVTFAEDDGAYTAGTEYAATTTVSDERKVSETDVAWLLLNNIIETNDIYNQTWRNGYRGRRLYRQDVCNILPEYGYTLKYGLVNASTQYTDLINMYVEDYQFTTDVALATDLTNHVQGVIQNTTKEDITPQWKLETEWPPASLFLDRNGIKQHNGVGAIISWPFGLGLEEYDYYIKAYKDFAHMDAEDVGGSYSEDSIPMYSFKLNRDAEITVFSKWIYGIEGRWDPNTNTPAFSKDAGWNCLSLSDRNSGLVVAQNVTSATSYDNKSLHEIFTRKYKAGDTVTICTPKATEYLVTFIKESKQSDEPDVLLSSVTIDGEALSGFDPNTFTYTYAVDANRKTAPVIKAVPNDGNAQVSVLYPTEFPGSATINVMCADGSEGTYTIHFTCDTALASNVVPDPEVTSWVGNNQSLSGNMLNIPVIREDLQVGSVILHDRYTNNAAKVTALDESLAGNTYITVGHEWIGNTVEAGDFEDVYRKTTLNTDWYTFDLKRDATVKIVYKGACNSVVSNYLEETGYCYNGKSSGYYLSAFNPTVNFYLCDTMYYKHFDIPEGQDKVTVSIPSFITTSPFVIIDFDGWN